MTYDFLALLLGEFLQSCDPASSWVSCSDIFGFIKILEHKVSGRSGCIRSHEALTLETSAFRISVRWSIYIRLDEKTDFHL